MTLRLEFAVTGMHCNSCGLLIDDEIEEVPGVTSSSTNLRTDRTVVELDHPVPTERILAAIASAGYSATALG
ncbi:heavy-metal-associated domain-containing protein [Streptomyces sp. NPDC001927]